MSTEDPLATAEAVGRLAEGIGHVYGETMGIRPERVEVCVGREHLSALLYHCGPPAEEALGAGTSGSHLLRDYYDACARELEPPLGDLIHKALAMRVRHLWLISAGCGRHRILVAAISPPAPEHAATSETST